MGAKPSFNRNSASRGASIPAQGRGVPVGKVDGTFVGAGAVGGVDAAVVDTGEMAPAAGTLGFVGTDGSRAWEATDGGKTHVVQRIDHHVRMTKKVSVEFRWF
jgi:hypothetical protein